MALRVKVENEEAWRIYDKAILDLDEIQTEVTQLLDVAIQKATEEFEEVLQGDPSGPAGP